MVVGVWKYLSNWWRDFTAHTHTRARTSCAAVKGWISKQSWRKRPVAGAGRRRWKGWFSKGERAGSWPRMQGKSWGIDDWEAGKGQQGWPRTICVAAAMAWLSLFGTRERQDPRNAQTAGRTRLTRKWGVERAACQAPPCTGVSPMATILLG